ncbi:uncharacterized protein LOC62_01G000362 [Vanrija pseudolonga]|uniref:Uncharacterized protein n=1 Tax=Vanrija pseudolonga TaxID=143232 RepID=A0AAF1BGU8_9TREE|nr:hypothetical protein LOC62_01G000362 [Vanrija pseudolonga]
MSTFNIKGGLHHRGKTHEYNFFWRKDAVGMFERAGRAAEEAHVDIVVLWSIDASKYVIRNPESCAVRAFVFWVEELLIAWLNTLNDRTAITVFPSTPYVGANMVSPLTQGVPGISCVDPEERLRRLRANALRYYYAHAKTPAQRAAMNAYSKAWRQRNGERESRRRREVYASRSDEQVAVTAAKRKEYYSSHRTEILAQKHGYYADNKTTILAKQKAAYQSNGPEILATRRSKRDERTDEQREADS